MIRLRNLLFCALTACLFFQCKTQQLEGGKFEPGKCYAKCKIPAIEYFDVLEVAVYTGDGEEDVEVVEKEILLKPAQKGWVKKKSPQPCLSSNPDDCLVWCLVDEEAVTQTFLVLVDTTQSKNFEIEKVERKVGESVGGNIEWREVVCEKDVSKSLISKIQQALSDQQFYDGAINGKLNRATRNALKSFQEENSLPYGQLDFETLDVLGVVSN